MFRRSRRAVVGGALAVGMSVAMAGAALAGPNTQASCVGLASAFFAGEGIRDQVAHAIKLQFGIPPGAEVSRFARVQLHDLEACLIDGQG